MRAASAIGFDASGLAESSALGSFRPPGVSKGVANWVSASDCSSGLWNGGLGDVPSEEVSASGSLEGGVSSSEGL